MADLTPIHSRAHFVGPEVLDRLFALPGDEGWTALRAQLRPDEPHDPWGGT